jgi:hypothetical protein
MKPAGSSRLGWSDSSNRFCTSNPSAVTSVWTLSARSVADGSTPHSDDGMEFRPRHVLIWARDAWEDQQAALGRFGGNEWIRLWKVPGVMNASR